MSEIAAAAFFSCLSGTRAVTMLVNVSSSLMKKKPMNTTENRPTPKLERNDVADPMIEETFETSKSFCISARMAVSILNSLPRLGNAFLSISLRLARGTDICPAALSMLLRDMPLTILLTIGIIIVMTARSSDTMTSSVKAARNQSGSFLPLI